MDSFELNKIAGAILFALVLVLGINFLSGEIFTHDADQPRGYQVELASDEAAAPEDATAEAEPEQDLATMIESASVEAGAKVAKKCVACHTFDEGGKNKVGPNLWNIVGRKPASVVGFKYSPAMQEYAATHDEWTFEAINEFVASPKNYINKTAMAYAGLKKEKDRAALLAYLRSLSSDPVPIN